MRTDATAEPKELLAMTSGEWVGLGAQLVAVAIAAFAAWQASRSADSSHKAVQELRAAREEEVWTRELHRLENIRRVVIAMKSLADQRQEGTPAFRSLRGELRAALPPPVGTQELIVCIQLADATKDEADLAPLALSEVNNVIVAHHHVRKQRLSEIGEGK